MAHSPAYSFDESTRDALDALAKQPGEENLGAPEDSQGWIQLSNFNPQTFTRLKIAVEPDQICVERADRKPFGIADYPRDRDNPIAALGQTVTGLTVERDGHGWTVRQHPDQEVLIDNPDSFELFWRILAMYVKDKRVRASQKAAS